MQCMQLCLLPSLFAHSSHDSQDKTTWLGSASGLLGLVSKTFVSRIWECLKIIVANSWMSSRLNDMSADQLRASKHVGPRALLTFTFGKYLR